METGGSSGNFLACAVETELCGLDPISTTY